MIKAKIVGAGGYGGVGITELILRHPNIEICCLVSLSDTGRKISEVYPHLQGACDQIIVSPDHPSVSEKYDVVIYSTPDGVGMKYAENDLNNGSKVIDYSGDFRFNSIDKYNEYINFIGKDLKHISPNLLSKTQYGLPEIHEINEKNQLIGNPGCFAVSCILALVPAVKNNLIEANSIICDCKTGTSGAGKKINSQLHHPNRYENMNAYRLSGHQHIIEIEEELNLFSNKDIKITFTAQLVPLCRGIMSVCYADLIDTISYQSILEIYNEFYKSSNFVRIFNNSHNASITDVRGSNFCNIVIDIDKRTGKLRIISYIDNLMKGQAGNAMQVLNHMFGYEPTTGLNITSQYP